MTYREKSAWLMLFAFAVTYGPYFAIVGSGVLPKAPLPDFHQLGLFAKTVVAQIVILIIGHVVLAARSPREVRAAADERDRAIEQRALTAAYYVLFFGMIVVGCIMPFTDRGWRIVNSALFMIVAAELVHYGVTVVSYRRQA